VIDYRPLVLQEIEARLPGLTLHRLRLHRHLPEADAMDAHAHDFSQILCYLGGCGVLIAGGREYEVGTGSLAYLPAGVVHGFRETAGRRPLSLAIDLVMPSASMVCVGRLSGQEAARVRRALSGLVRLRDPGGVDARILAASAGLAILDVVLRAAGILPREAAAEPAFVRRFQRLAADPAKFGVSIAALAAETGYQPDYLNRKFKETTGLSLRQQRHAIRLELAKKALAKGLAVQDAAMEGGFDDPNYFARWFKRQTGMSPSEFARHRPR